MPWSRDVADLKRVLLKWMEEGFLKGLKVQT